jgi:hypothetical protein
MKPPATAAINPGNGPTDNPPPPGPTLALVALGLLARLGEAFCQQRTALRAWRLAVAQTLALGSRTISRLISGLRFFHLAIVVAPWRLTGAADVPARAIPVRFEPSPTVKKPGKRASEAEFARYKKALKARPGSVQARKELEQLREDADAAGAAARTMIATLDGGFCCRVFFKDPMRGIEVLARCRKDAVLCAAAGPEEGPCFYSRKKFTPEEVRKDDGIPWHSATVRTGGREHALRYKELGVFWQGGAGRRPLRLIVIAPTGYRLHQKGKLLYRQPAFLLTTDLTRDAAELIQGYVDRWQIEVAHGELKDGFGIQDSQVRHPRSVPRHPGFDVAVYAMLHLAAILAHGPRRTADYLPTPKWYAGGVRPSLLDIVRLLRHKIPACPPEELPSGADFSAAALVEKAAA